MAEAAILCGCGCGESLNPLLAPALELRDHNLTFREIGERLGADKKYLQMLVRNPPRFVKGHSGRVQQWVTKVCPACGDEFRTTTGGRSYCNKRACVGSGLASDAHVEFIERLDRQEAEVAQRRRESVRHEARMQREAKALLTVPADLSERKRERERNIAAARTAHRLGERFVSPCELPPLELSEELAALAEAQAHEMKWEDKAWFQWMVQLDAPIRYRRITGLEHEEGGTALDKLETSEGDPFDVITSEESADELASILGTLDEQKLARMDDNALDHMRDQLREAGFVPHDIQRRERERLGRATRHRGGAPPPTHSRMTTKHKHRKPGHQKSAGSKRGARKPKRRWTREDAMEYAA